MMEYIRWWAASNLSACSYSNDNEGLFGPGTCPVSCAWGYRQNFIFNLWERRKFEQPYAGSFRVWRMTVLTHCYPILCCCYGWVNQLLHNKCLPWASSLCSSRTHNVLFWIHPISSHSRCATFHFQRIKFLWVWPGFRERTLSNESPLQNDERLNTDWLLLVNIKIQFHPGWVDQILPLQTQWTTTTATRAAYHALLQTIDHGGDPSWSWEREIEERIPSGTVTSWVRHGSAHLLLVASIYWVSSICCCIHGRVVRWWRSIAISVIRLASIVDWGPLVAKVSPELPMEDELE